MPAYTVAHYRMMQRVITGVVLHHDSTEPCCPGFSWSHGSMSSDPREIVEDLFRRGHIWVGVHTPCGSPVFESAAGIQAMRMFAESNAGLQECA